MLLHATLEDCIRSISSALLPNSGEAPLNRVPLIGTAGSRRAEKFFLGRLAVHREKLVSTLIKESVDSYLRHVTFNNSNEIAEHLKELGFELAPMREALSTIEEMMKRRHQIVHRADYDDCGKLAERLTSIRTPAASALIRIASANAGSFSTATIEACGQRRAARNA